MKKILITLPAIALACGSLLIGCGGGDEEPNPLNDADPPEPGVPDLPSDEGEGN